MKNPTNITKQSIFSFSAGLIAMFLGGVLAVGAQAPAADSPGLEAKAHAMVAKLTLQQKIELIGGVDSMFTQAAPTIGLPRLKMSDASVGVRTWGPTTAYAGGVALAATWDRAFARQLGQALGKDARARGVNFFGESSDHAVDIRLSPQNQRMNTVRKAYGGSTVSWKDNTVDAKIPIETLGLSRDGILFVEGFSKAPFTPCDRTGPRAIRICTPMPIASSLDR